MYTSPSSLLQSLFDSLSLSLFCTHCVGLLLSLWVLSILSYDHILDVNRFACSKHLHLQHRVSDCSDMNRGECTFSSRTSSALRLTGDSIATRERICRR